MLNKGYFSLLYVSGSIIDEFVFAEFVAETKYPEKLKKEIIKCFKNTKITKEDVERVKKVKLSIEVVESDKPFQVLNTALTEILDYGDIIYNKIDIIKSITLEDVLKVAETIDFSNSSFMVGYPKE